ncbi:MAG: ImmA/IrrE family metallo-endopeptidase [Nitrospira sp.]|nr:ImmA/IrrE family metallo-endopeptidase [Nitrospira sp.]
MSKAAIEAERLLEDLGLTDLPVKPEEVCQAMTSSSYPITFEVQPMATSAFHGISMGNARDGATILVNANIANPHRKRFTAAHEIGHVHLHIQTDLQSQFECTSQDISAGENSNNAYEKEANAFASSLLMPSSAVSPLVHRNDLTWSLVREISDLCDVSLEAAARRAIALSKECCCLIIHKDGEMWFPVKSRSFSAYLPHQAFPQYLERQPDGGTTSPLPDGVDECNFSDWAFPDRVSGKLFYSAIHNAEFDRTMTLLIHEEEVDDDADEVSEPHF